MKGSGPFLPFLRSASETEHILKACPLKRSVRGLSRRLWSHVIQTRSHTTSIGFAHYTTRHCPCISFRQKSSFTSFNSWAEAGPIPSGLSHIPPYVAIGEEPYSHTPCCGLPLTSETEIPSTSSVSHYRRMLTLPYVYTTPRPVRCDPLLCVRRTSTTCLPHIPTASRVWT